MAKYQPKYFYRGKTLQEYCKEKEFSYSSARNFISKMKKTSDLSDEEILELAIASLEKGRTKYFYQGVSLAEYCRENDIDNTCVRKKIRQLIESEEYGSSCTDEIVKIAIDYVLQDKVMYYIGNQTLGEYCAEKGIIYMSIINKINTYKKKNSNSKLSNNELAVLAVENYLPCNTIYYVNDEPLFMFCERNGKSPSNFVRKLKEIPGYNRDTRKRIDIPFELAKDIVENIKDPNGTIYYYDNQTLKQYCLIQELPYESIIRLINEHKRENLPFTIETFVKKYMDIKEVKNRLRDKQDLKIKYNNPEFLNYYCKKYNISLQRVADLTKMGYELYTAVNIIYYVSDINLPNGEKSVTEVKLKELELLRNKEDKDLDDLLLLQGLGFFGFDLSIVKRVEGLIVNTIKKYRVKKNYFLEYKEYLEELVLRALEKDFTMRPAQFIVYLEKYLNGSLINILYQSDKIATSADSFNNTIVNNSLGNIEENYIAEERRKTVRQVITCLDENEFLFITRKYGFIGSPLTIEEMQRQYYPESSLEELKNMEMDILNKLRDNKEVQKLLIKD